MVIPRFLNGVGSRDGSAAAKRANHARYLVDKGVQNDRPLFGSLVDHADIGGGSATLLRQDDSDGSSERRLAVINMANSANVDVRLAAIIITHRTAGTCGAERRGDCQCPSEEKLRKHSFVH